MLTNKIKQLSGEAAGFLSDFYNSRRIIFVLARREFKITYGTNYLGFAWAVLEPLTMMMILLLVFTYLRARASNDYPFVVYLLSGVVAFEFFNKSLMQATRSIKFHSFLLKQGGFRMAILPIINILSTLKTHLVILIIAVSIFAFFGVYPSFYWFQLIYYIFAVVVLLIGLSWITASLVLFIPDIQYIINIVIRTAFFLTPIFWDMSMFPPKAALILKLNPLYHIVEGYRNCFLYHQAFWSDTYSFVSFWIITSIIFITGIFVFKRLRPHFADVV
ncbi:MAG: ABC transporter permease [Bacteroidales bacterium]|nr:ABC transporter permease [Bacteroidales bacterium]